MNRAVLLKKLGIIPWVPREPGQEAHAMVLHQASDQPGARHGASADQKTNLPHNRSVHLVEHVSEKAPVGQTSQGPDLPKHNQGEVCGQGEALGQGEARGQAKVRGDQVIAQIAVHQGEGSHQVPRPLSLLYAQVHPRVWLVAECDEWDRGSQELFERLVDACMKVAPNDQASSPELQWFFWPLRLPALVNNDERNLRQALRGWVQGRKEPGTLWVSLGRRFVDILLDTELASGQLHEGRSGMSVVWFSALPAMQIDPSFKVGLWQFLRARLTRPGTGARALQSPSGE